jgi:hypothetical protein
MRRLLLVIPASIMLSSCQTWGPTWSEVSGQRWNIPSEAFNTAPTAVQTIDGNSAFPNPPGQAIKVDPGEHTLVLAAAPLLTGATYWPGGTDLETMKYTFEPCKRYYINGRYDTRLGTSWTPFIDYVEPISGCTVVASAK